MKPRFSLRYRGHKDRGGDLEITTFLLVSQDNRHPVKCPSVKDSPYLQWSCGCITRVGRNASLLDQLGGENAIWRSRINDSLCAYASRNAHTEHNASVLLVSRIEIFVGGDTRGEVAPDEQIIKPSHLCSLEDSSDEEVGTLLLQIDKVFHLLQEGGGAYQRPLPDGHPLTTVLICVLTQPSS